MDEQTGWAYQGRQKTGCTTWVMGRLQPGRRRRWRPRPSASKTSSSRVLNDLASTHLRIHRPLGPGKCEVTIWCSAEVSALLSTIPAQRWRRGRGGSSVEEAKKAGRPRQLGLRSELAQVVEEGPCGTRISSGRMPACSNYYCRRDCVFQRIDVLQPLRGYDLRMGVIVVILVLSSVFAVALVFVGVKT